MHGRVTELGCVVLQAVQKSHDGEDNHTCVHCSEVGFIVPLISGMFLSGAYTCISFFMLTQRHGYNGGLVAEYLISLCDE